MFSALRERSQKILSDKEAEMEIIQKELNELTSSKVSKVFELKLLQKYFNPFLRMDKIHLRNCCRGKTIT